MEFLQENDLNLDVCIVTPADLVSEGIIWKVLKPLNGMVSATKPWYDKICEVINDCGFSTCMSDDGLLRISDNDGEVNVIPDMHADDAMGGDTE